MERSFQRGGAVTACATGADTRGRVIRAAAELFAGRGFAATSISAIREASGVLPSSIYWEFGSKEGVLAAVLDDSASRWLEQARECAVRTMAMPEPSAACRLGAYLDYLADELARRPDFLRLLLLLSLERREVDARSIEVIRDVRQRATQSLAWLFIEAGIVERRTPECEVMELARASLACFDGAFVAAQIDPDTTDLHRMFSLLRTGIGAAIPPADTRAGGRTRGAGSQDESTSQAPVRERHPEGCT